MKHTVEVMIPEAEIKARIAELGRQITERYKDSGSDMVLVGLLRGSFMFMADLCREVQVSHEVDFMTASSYGSGMSTTRDVKILKDLDEDIRGKDVLIVEDIIDSGNTLSKVREILSLREPKSLAICTLLDNSGISPNAFRAALTCSSGEARLLPMAIYATVMRYPHDVVRVCVDDEYDDAVTVLHPAR